MILNVRKLIGFTLSAEDGDIGTIKDFYFDDLSWTVRYVIVETGGWLFGRKVLIAPVELHSPDPDNERFRVNLTKNQIRNSPDVSTDKPVSLQQQYELSSYYGWADYGGQWGMGYIPISIPDGIITPLDKSNDANSAQQNDDQHGKDPHLRSCRKVQGYSVHGLDGELGEVEDFLIHIDDWRVPFIIVACRKWYLNKSILLITSSVKNIEWESSGIYVDNNKENCTNAPDFDFNFPIPNELESKLISYYPKINP